MAGNSLEHQFRMGKLTHLMEKIRLASNDERPLFECGQCELKIVASNLSEARQIAERTYGKCGAQ